MKVVKKTKEYVIYQKGSGRYAVKNADKQWVNADEKVAILVAEGLIKTAITQSVSKEEPVESSTVEDVASGATEESPVEEAPAEEAPAQKPKTKAAPKKTKAASKAKAAPKAKAATKAKAESKAGE